MTDHLDKLFTGGGGHGTDPSYYMPPETNSIRCPHCHDLFIPDNGRLPDHYLDIGDTAPICPGAVVRYPYTDEGIRQALADRPIPYSGK